MKWFLYIARGKDGSFYTGITTNTKRRIWQHNSRKGAKSLKGKLPIKLVYTEVYNSQAEASKREKAIKGWKREYKLKLISNKQGDPR